MRPFPSTSSLALAVGITVASLLGSVQPSTSSSSPLGLPLAEAPVAHAQSSTFVETFTGRPSSPAPYRPSGWDIAVHSRDIDTWQQPESMMAGHGADCAAHPANHQISQYQDTVYQCNDHLMTAINASGYGAIYLTPNHLVDFTNGEATVRFDMSTLRTSSRDWIDVWVTPFEDNIPAPLDAWLPDLAGPPKRAIHLRMDTFNGTTVFKGFVFHNLGETELPANWWTGYETFLTPSAVRRDTFELRLSKTSLKFGMPAYNNFQWIDQQFPALDWSRGVVQFSHHSYNPSKDCGGASCTPNTWHWDNVQISPAVPFTILSGNRGLVTASSPSVTFAGPALADSFLRLMGIGDNLQASYDGGPWQNLPKRQTTKSPGEAFKPYWAPVPAGVRQVTFRGSDWWGGPWAVNNASIWSLNTEGGAGPPPTTTATAPAATATATPTPAAPTATATAPAATVTATILTATATVTPTASLATATATPTSTVVPATATATATTTPTPPSGSRAGALKLTGAARATVPYAPELNLTGDWTVELWFKDEYSVSGGGTFNHAPQTLLIAGETDSDPDIPVHIWLEWGSLNAGDRSGWNHHVARYYLQGHNVAANTWHHLAVTKSASTRRIQLVLDGQLIVDGIVGGQNPSQAGRPLTIGRNGSQHNWRGKLDDIRIWNVVRPVTEITAGYRAELTGTPPGLVANWKLNEAAGAMAMDSAGSPQNATLRNGATWTTDTHR